MTQFDELGLVVGTLSGQGRITRDELKHALARQLKLKTGRVPGRQLLNQLIDRSLISSRVTYDADAGTYQAAD